MWTATHHGLNVSFRAGFLTVWLPERAFSGTKRLTENHSGSVVHTLIYFILTQVFWFSTRGHVTWNHHMSTVPSQSRIGDTCSCCKLSEAQVGASTRLQLALFHDRRVDCNLELLVAGCWPFGAAGPLKWGSDYWNCMKKLIFGTCHRWA